MKQNNTTCRKELPGEKFSQIVSKAFRLDSGVGFRASTALL